MQQCIVCHKPHTSVIYQDKKRCYFLCPRCQAVFVDQTTHFPPQVEAKRFQKPQPNKQRRLHLFVLTLLEQLHQVEKTFLYGLNFGRVVDIATTEAVNELGHQLINYDPYLAPDRFPLQRSYDFVCSYHVIEHFKNPLKEWYLLSQLVRHHGWLVVSTRLLSGIENLAKWHHKNNPTHVCFYQLTTIEYLAKTHGFTLLFANDEFILMQKTSKSDITRGQKPTSPFPTTIG